MEILKVENLTKTYGSGENLVNAVDDVSFSVEKGEFVAIVGASGSGKSTLLHLIGGVDRPTSGKIFVDGNDISKMNDDKLAVFRRRQVGIVYQFYNLIPILTVEENITLPCDLDGRGVDRERLEMILDSFDCVQEENTFQTSFRAVSNREHLLPERSLTIRLLCLPMNRQATLIQSQAKRL